MSHAIQPAQEDATKRVLKQRRQLERRIAHLEAINTVLRKELPAKNDQIALLEERIANMSEHEHIIAKLEAINLVHRAELSAKNERIAVLEEKISTMSVDLASSRAREDKQRMLIRRLSQDSAISESDRMEVAELVEDYNKSCLSQSPKSPSSSSSISSRQFHRGFSLPGWVNSSTSNNNNTILEYKQLRRSSQGSAMSVSDDNDIFPAEHVDDSMKSSSSPAQVSSPSSSNYRQFNRGFSLPGWVSSSISSSNNNNAILDVSEGDDDILPAEAVDDSMKSSLSPSSSSPSSNNRQFNRRFSLPNWVSSSNVADDTINDSTRSSSGGVGGIISNLMKSERSNSCNNLRVDFPAGGREAHRLRMSGCLRMSDLTSDYSAEVDDEASDQEEEDQEQNEGEEGGGQQSTQQRRRPPNRSRSHNMGSFNSRLMSSTVVFPKEGDDDNLGFE